MNGKRRPPKVSTKNKVKMADEMRAKIRKPDPKRQQRITPTNWERYAEL